LNIISTPTVLFKKGLNISQHRFAIDQLGNGGSNSFFRFNRGDKAAYFDVVRNATPTTERQGNLLFGLFGSQISLG